jgi:hypothetical protein
MIRTLLRNLLDKTLKRLFVGLLRREDLDVLYDQIAGLIQIQSAMSGGPVLKPLREFAISPDTMAWILADLQERESPTIVEFGSGQSTVIFAFCLKHKGAGRLISFEHDPVYAASIRRQLETCGVGERVDIQILPLVDREPVGALPACQTYAIPDPPGLVVDLALIDGPPYWNGASARYYPLQWAVERLSANGAAYLDDTVRVDERRVVSELSTHRPDLLIEDLRAQKGLTRFTRRGPGAGH